MSRLSSVVGRTPIADKIKIFDASATVKSRPAHVPAPLTPSNKEPSPPAGFLCEIFLVLTSVADPDPSDPCVFGPPGSGSGADPSIIKIAKIVRKTLILTVL